MSAPKSVAQIDQAKATELGVNYQDANGNYLVNLDYGDILEPEEFKVVKFVTRADGILPPKRNKN